MVGEDQGKLLVGIRQSRAAAEQEAEQQQNGPLVLTPHMTRALQRNIIMPHRRGAPLNQEVRNDVRTNDVARMYTIVKNDHLQSDPRSTCFLIRRRRRCGCACCSSRADTASSSSCGSTTSTWPAAWW